MIRRLLFILFLYVVLVWLIAAYLHADAPRQIVDRGLFWTALGVGALLAWLLLERVFGWWRAQRATKPAAPNAATPTQKNEDDAAFLSLLTEANQRLRQVPGVQSVKPWSVSDLPLYLMLGLDGAGKTATFQNCGIEPALLAGQVSGAGTITPTKVANFWLANQSIFVEIGGRVFNSEPSRLTAFVNVLKAAAGATGWRSWLEDRRQTTVRAVILFVDIRRFTGTPEASSLDKMAQQIRERLSAVCKASQTDLPVYILFTKTDAIPHFSEFLSKFAESEAGQVFGTLCSDEQSSQSQDRVWAEAETKRLNREFQSLFRRLSDRRLLALAQESDLARKPGIYEFPREFKRIRTPLVQFLVDIFRPNPLNSGPRLRGFFFTAVRKTERSAAADIGVTGVSHASSVGSDATLFFSAEKMGSIVSPTPIARSGSQPLIDRWTFTSDFFHRVLSQDQPVITAARGPSKSERNKSIAVAAAASILCFLAFVWTVSWLGNRQLTAPAQNAIADVRAANTLNLSNLQALDRLRRLLEQLDQSDSWTLHWGLYSGNAVRAASRQVYFDSLKKLSLSGLNQTLVVQLRQAGTGGRDVATRQIYDQLKTHRTITVLGCSVDRPLLARVLKSMAAAEPSAHLGESEIALLNTQLDFYVTQLDKGGKPPVVLIEDGIAEENARAYLQKATGPDQQLQILLAELGSKLKPLKVSEFAENYASVLAGPADFSGIFTKTGLQASEKLIAEGNFSGSGDSCVTGQSGGGLPASLNSDSRDRLKSLYYRRYADAWRDFLHSYNVIRYSGVADAAQRLGILSGPRSPLLGLVKLVAVNTNFPPPKTGELSWWEKQAQKVGLDNLVQNKSKLDKEKDDLQRVLGNDAPLMTTADLARLFQPALFTTPPDADQLVSDHNGEYIKALRGLQQNLDALAHASTAEKAATIPQARAALAQARTAYAGLADKFSDVGNEGLSKQLADLLEQPIRFAETVIPANIEISSGGKKNTELAEFCRTMSPILTKYPFSSSSPMDATLNDIERGFAPTTGAVWKYLQQSASDLVIPNGQEWQQNPSLQGMKVTPELLQFLKAGQDVKRAFYADGATMQPKLKYVLRPVPRQTIKILLKLDGADLDSTSVLQKTFYWPGPPESRGASGTVEAGLKAGFGSYDGLWGIFRLFQNADERPIAAGVVQWSRIRGMGGAGVQPLNPPAKVELLELPGGVDLFNPKFFEALRCPSRAVVVN